jgi:hypothetical protein
MKKYLLILIFALCLCVNSAHAKERFDFNGYLKSEVAMRTDGHGNTTLNKFKNFIDLAGQYKIMGEELVFFAHTRYWYDAAYGLSDKLDRAQYYMAHVQRTDWLRDCYLDIIRGPWFLRLGKQQVSWGQADGIPILDRVNPVDFTEYLLPDVADIRIPLWMANINYSPKLNSNIQILVIPDFEQSSAAPPGAPFTFRSYRLFMAAKEGIEAAPGAPNKLPFGSLGTFYNGTLNTNIYYPAKKFKNSKFGVQWSDRISDWDYTLNYLYGYDYLARTFPDSTIVVPHFFPPPPRPADVTLNYSRRFKIDQLVGGSLNHSFTRKGPLEGVTLRGDFAVYINEPTYYGDPATGSSTGVSRWNNIFWLIGLDRYFFTKWLASFQYAQYILEHSKTSYRDSRTGVPCVPLNTYTNGAQDKVENIFALKISTRFLNDRFKPELVWGFTDDNQGKLSPKLSYEITDQLVLTLGWHYFYGKETESNGEFRHQSQVYTQLKYSF